MPSSINVSDSKTVCNILRPDSCCFCDGAHFWKHGHYIRTGFYLTVKKILPPEEKIQRYLCKSSACDRTFSGLPEGVLPYCRFFLEDFLLLYKKSLAGGSAWSLFKACQLVEVSFRAIQRLLSLFKKVLALVEKLFLEVDGDGPESLASMSHFLIQKYSWFGFTYRWYHALYPARLWEIQNPHNLGLNNG